MKRIIPLILACILLCGCAAKEIPEESTSLPTIAETEPQATEPAGFYDPDSAIESQTNGAVRAYPLDIPSISGILPMGENLLVFATSEASTVLTQLSGEQLYPAATAQISTILTPETPSLRVSEMGITYYNAAARQTVVLDTSLKEISHIPAPDDMIGVPVLSADRNTLYYCTAASIRAWDLETGIRRILKEISYPTQDITGLWLEDTVLQCYISDDDGANTMFLSTQTGEILYMTGEDLAVTASSDRYFANVPAGANRLLVFGQPDENPQMLMPEDPSASCYFLTKSNAAVTVSQDEDGQYRLDYYDLDTGLCSSSLPLSGGAPWYVADGGEGIVWFLTYEETSGDTLFRWDTSALPAGNETVCTTAYHAADDPDLEGLAQCQLYADEIGSRHGVEILVYEAATQVQPWDYDMQTEYLVPIIRQELEQLDQRLSNYPAGMLQTLAERFDGLKICIVRQLNGTAESGSLETATGIQFMEEQVAYIALATGTESEHALYHEMCHLIDTMILTESSAYDTWESLNPSSFEYDYSYITNAQRDTGIYLQDGIRAFIDVYSMSYPKEDRARIMEYAMTEGNADLFRSDTMQAKLELLCTGIRQAFDLRKSPETFLWEQYLEESLAYTE